MKYNYRKIFISILIMLFLSLCMVSTCFAHSGRTDKNGGHKDNKNASGLGSYHYHCEGYPPHLHQNGVCPYASSSSSQAKSSTSSGSSSEKSESTSTSKSNSSSSSSKSSNSNNKSVSSSSATSTTNNNSTSSTNSSEKDLSSTKATSTVPSTIMATGIKINEFNYSMEIGETKKLTATITPEDVTDKDINWKSNDETVATINEAGEVTAKKSGVASIIASTSNGKIDTIAINVKEKQIEDLNNITNTEKEKTVLSLNSNLDDTNENSNSKDFNLMGGIITAGLLGGGGYLGYKKYKNNREK